MICINIKCDNGKVSVVETRSSKSEMHTHRRYHCLSCDALFNTVEIHAESPAAANKANIQQAKSLKAILKYLKAQHPEEFK